MGCLLPQAGDEQIGGGPINRLGARAGLFRQNPRSAGHAFALLSCATRGPLAWPLLNGTSPAPADTGDVLGHLSAPTKVGSRPRESLERRQAHRRTLKAARPPSPDASTKLWQGPGILTVSCGLSSKAVAPVSSECIAFAGVAWRIAPLLSDLVWDWCDAFLGPARMRRYPGLLYRLLRC